MAFSVSIPSLEFLLELRLPSCGVRVSFNSRNVIVWWYGVTLSSWCGSSQFTVTSFRVG